MSASAPQSQQKFYLTKENKNPRRHQHFLLSWVQIPLPRFGTHSCIKRTRWSHSVSGAKKRTATEWLSSKGNSLVHKRSVWHLTLLTPSGKLYSGIFTFSQQYSSILISSKKSTDLISATNSVTYAALIK